MCPTLLHLKQRTYQLGVPLLSSRCGEHVDRAVTCSVSVAICSSNFCLTYFNVCDNCSSFLAISNINRHQKACTFHNRRKVNVGNCRARNSPIYMFSTSTGKKRYTKLVSALFQADARICLLIPSGIPDKNWCKINCLRTVSSVSSGIACPNGFFSS